MTTVLVTGFDEFGPHVHNPSGELADLLDGTTLAGARLVGRRLRVATETVGADLEALLDQARPDVVVCLGLASGRDAISLERIAANVRDFPIPDAAGVTLQDRPVLEGGPDGVLTGLPVRAVLEALAAGGIPAHISGTAGAYICNQIFYLAALAGRRLGIPAGFVHLPDTPASLAAAGKDEGPTLPLEVLRRGVEIVIETTLVSRGGHGGR